MSCCMLQHVILKQTALKADLQYLHPIKFLVFLNRYGLNKKTRVTTRFVTRFNLWLRHNLWPQNASICDPARFVTKSASICDQCYAMILECKLCRGKLVVLICGPYAIHTIIQNSHFWRFSCLFCTDFRIKAIKYVTFWTFLPLTENAGEHRSKCADHIYKVHFS